LVREACERLYCWIDLNVPNHGSWKPPMFQQCDQQKRRCELQKAFANNPVDPEGEFAVMEAEFRKRTPVAFRAPPPDAAVKPDGLQAAGFPRNEVESRKLQEAGPHGTRKTVDLGGGVTMTLAWIPAGEFVLGSLAGAPDERPRAVVHVERPFWMAVTETTNEQYARFDPEHDTRYIDMHYMDHVVPGHIANHPRQPVARVSWWEAQRYCRWMARRSGLRVALPSEAQWEWAARAGTPTQFFYGTLETNFGRFANLADQSLRWYRMGFDGPSALPRRYAYPAEMNFPLHDERFRDQWHVVDYVGQVSANAWGLRDMVGNVSEWTRSAYRSYPYVDNDGRNDENLSERRSVRGGSWADRPVDAGSSVRRGFEPWQRVHDVGFRVIVADDPVPERSELVVKEGP
jgi:formylglycine-generating enzyme required for sulfatase activity